MAIIRPVRAKDRPPYYKRTIITSTWRGVLRVSGWPRRRPKRPTTWDASIREQLKIWMAWLPQISSREQTPMRNAVAQHNKAHTGMKANASIRFRDLEIQRFAGRLFAFGTEDGHIVWPWAAWMDVSNTLDWFTDTPGGLLIRGPAQWQGLPPGEANHAIEFPDFS